MARFSRAPGRGTVRVAIALIGAAAAAVALGALHGGAATPSTQSVAVPDKAGQTVTAQWTGTIPAAARTRRTTATAPASATTTQGIDRDDPAQGLRPDRRDVHVPDHVDAEQPDRRRGR